MSKRKNKRWTPEEVQRLVKLYPTTPVAELAEMFGCSIGHVYVIASEHGAKKRKQKGGHNAWPPVKVKKFIRLYAKTDTTELMKIFGCTRAALATRASDLGLRKNGIHHWTEPEKQMLSELYPDTANPELAKIFRVNEGKIKNMATRLNLHKSEQFMSDPINGGRFRKGQRPPNKGKKQVSFMSAEGIERTRATRFKKGHLPKNTLSDGIIVTRHGHKKRGGRPYKWIRVGLAQWKQYHVYLWEQAYGPVPEGHIIIFRDKDTMNCKLENLEMITRQEHARRNYNREKATSAVRNLSDKYVAGIITQRNPNLRKKIINEPELLEAARANMLLKRQIKQQKKHEPK